MYKLYKFKKLDNMERLISLLESGQFYCSDFRKLNDPMEGAFNVGNLQLCDSERISEYCRKIYDIKTKKRILSLSAGAKFVYMWAHYAEGFSGVAIEVEINTDDYRQASKRLFNNEKSLYKVKYVKTIETIDKDALVDNETVVYKALTTKLHDWRMEKEFRYIQDSEIKELTITNVFFGMRVDKEKELKIKEVCFKKNISVSQTCLHRPTSLVESINLGVPR